ncbi:MAG: hypothetical protein ACT4QC_19490, partial [Planctomycetaceae bacterium]
MRRVSRRRPSRCTIPRPRAAPPRLDLTRLEERRVLNGGAVVVIALTADGGGQGQNAQQPAPA